MATPEPRDARSLGLVSSFDTRAAIEEVRAGLLSAFWELGQARSPCELSFITATNKDFDSRLNYEIGEKQYQFLEMWARALFAKREYGTLIRFVRWVKELRPECAEEARAYLAKMEMLVALSWALRRGVSGGSFLASMLSDLETRYYREADRDASWALQLRTLLLFARGDDAGIEHLISRSDVELDVERRLLLDTASALHARLTSAKRGDVPSPGPIAPWVRSITKKVVREIYEVLVPDEEIADCVEDARGPFEKRMHSVWMRLRDAEAMYAVSLYLETEGDEDLDVLLTYLLLVEHPLLRSITLTGAARDTRTVMRFLGAVLNPLLFPRLLHVDISDIVTHDILAELGCPEWRSLRPFVILVKPDMVFQRTNPLGDVYLPSGEFDQSGWIGNLGLDPDGEEAERLVDAHLAFYTRPKDFEEGAFSYTETQRDEMRRLTNELTGLSFTACGEDYKPLREAIFAACLLLHPKMRDECPAHIREIIEYLAPMVAYATLGDPCHGTEAGSGETQACGSAVNAISKLPPLPPKESYEVSSKILSNISFSTFEILRELSRRVRLGRSFEKDVALADDLLSMFERIREHARKSGLACCS